MPLHRYCDHLPATKLRAGLYLVHNHVVPQSPIGMNGLRAWVTDANDRLVKCNCNFGGCKNAEVNPHYRVKDLGVSRRTQKDRRIDRRSFRWQLGG